MGKRTINVCDCCGKEIENEEGIFKITLQSVGQWISYQDNDYNYVNIELCEGCSRRVVVSLEKIVEKFGLE